MALRKIHKHRAVKAEAKDYAWTSCVNHFKPHNEQPHGDIERVDVCRCGAFRRSEHNSKATVYGEWREWF